MKFCPKCEETKAKSEFHSQKDKRDGLRAHCKICVRGSNLTRYRESLSTKRAHNAANRRYYLKKYNLTEDAFIDLLDRCDYKFEICEKDVVPFGSKEARSNIACVDHCHDTGEIRGILCNRCNSGIGMLGDTVHDIGNALSYLIRNDRCGK